MSITPIGGPQAAPEAPAGAAGQCVAGSLPGNLALGGVRVAVGSFRRKPTAWTDAEKDALRQAWGDLAWDRADIAKSLRRGFGACCKMATKLGLRRPGRVAPRMPISPGRTSMWDQFKIARARILWDEGVSKADMARHFGCSEDSISGLATRQDWPIRANAWNNGSRGKDPPPPEPIAWEPAEVSLSDAREWAALHAKGARTLAEVNAARAGFGLPPFVVRRMAA